MCAIQTLSCLVTGWNTVAIAIGILKRLVTRTAFFEYSGHPNMEWIGRVRSLGLFSHDFYQLAAFESFVDDRSAWCLFTANWNDSDGVTLEFLFGSSNRWQRCLFLCWSGSGIRVDGVTFWMGLMKFEDWKNLTHTTIQVWYTNLAPIHGAGVFTYMWLIFIVNVAKYTYRTWMVVWVSRILS